GILEYLAYEKTRRSCEGEWLTLYRGAERRMKEAEERARENKRRFVRKDGDYAAWMEQAVKEEKEYPVSGITDILEQDTLREDKDGKLTPVLDEYFAALLENIRGRLPDLSEQERLIKAVRVVPPDSFFHPGRGKTQFLSALGDVYDVLLSSYRLLLTEIRGSYKRLIENVLSFDLPEEGVRSNPLSVTENLLKRNRSHIHPVSAMTQLCFLKVAVTRYLNAKGSRTWEDLEKGEAQTLPEELLFLDENPVLPADAKSKKSTYLTKGTQRFSAFMPHTPGEKQYLKAKTHVHTDSLSLKADGLSLFETLKTEAANQLITLVLQGVSERLDKLIEAYRSFFGRFEDAKKGLNDAAKLSLQRDAGISGSVIHVYSDEKAKKAIFADLFEKNGETPEEMRKAKSIAGENVLSIALAEARHALNEESDKEDEGEVFRELFDRMVEGYREAIRKNTAFRELSDYSVLRAMEKAGQKDKGEDFLRKTEELFATAVELSEPSLKLDQNFKSKVGVRAERLLVVMMSKGTARYVRTHEEKFDLSLSVNDEVDEDNLNESAAQVFVSRFISATARCVVTEGIPDNTLYISSQTLNILPLAVSKFDELNAGSMYFRSYETALHNLEAGGTDVWNPHLGFHLHKRGHLPYMNPVKEEQCDKELCKALLYGLIYGKLYMRKAKGEPLCFRYFENGQEYMARGDDGDLIGEMYISMIFSWMREREDFISLWSRAFDSEWEAETQKLPPAESMEELADLKRGLREMPILKALRTDVLQGRDKDGKDEAAPRMCLFDFAYSVKSTEENARDCNDAERILRVAYELLMEVCRRKTGGDDSCFAAVYTAQTDGFYEHFALSDRVRKASGPRVYMERIIGWLDESGLFRRIPDDDRYEKDGKTLRFVPYVLPADIIRKIDKWQEKKEKDDAAEEKAEAADRDETKADNP
ncbi:MAG: hypothetical protein MJ078_01740, partial [Clostridia bacterium]|nr:hypothetical protein [Clostridia bacterium]